MPSKLDHWAKRGPRDSSFDHFIQKLLDERGFGFEREYVGIVTQDRANQVRLGMRKAGQHLGVSVKAFWKPCEGCKDGGNDCRFHVSFTAYDPEVARDYKARLAEKTREN